MFSALRKGVLRAKILSVNSVCKQVYAYSIPTSSLDSISVSAKKRIGIWLATLSGMTFGAVVLGGVTRLTESGLSMTNWHLLKERPPFGHNEWVREFERYKQYPEYHYVSAEKGEMTLNDFKSIWWMEYGHRMWGRAIGVAFAVPAAVFYYKGYFNRAMKSRVLIYGSLIGFQGLLGWYMVKSGLDQTRDQSWIPRVSQYRLAAHLGSAIVLYSLFFWNTLNHLTTPTHLSATIPALSTIRALTYSVKFMVVLTALSGAFVAGLDAGLVYNSWPKMADRWIPSDIVSLTPAWLNIFENQTTVQFDHRWLGQITGLLVGSLWFVCYKNRGYLPKRVQLAANALGVAALTQITLGVSTLVHYVPVVLAACHQGGSLVLLSCALWLSHLLKKAPK